jgi:hypothetical protein
MQKKGEIIFSNLQLGTRSYIKIVMTMTILERHICTTLSGRLLLIYI